MMLSMCKKMNFKGVFVFISLSVLLITGCTKLENTSLGGDFIPGSDKLYTDTMLLPVETFSFIENDTTVVEKNQQHIIGFLNDPMFGTTTATAYFQMQPAVYPFVFAVSKDSLYLDSAVLSLSYGGIYGDTNAISGVKVYKLTDTSFKIYSRYTADKGFHFSTSDLLGTSTFKATELRKGYKLSYKTDSVYNELRIRLTDQFGRLILDQSNQNSLLTDSAFKVLLNGLVVVPDSVSSGNALHYFNLNASNSRINVYYRALTRTGAIDTTVAIFPYNGTFPFSSNANKIYRNYNGSLAQSYLNSNTPGQFAYILTAPGTSVKVKVSGLDTLVGKKYIIHRAELVARQVYQGPVSLESILTPPYLHMFTYDANGKNAPIPYDSLNYFSAYSYDYIREVSLYSVTTSYTGGFATYHNDLAGNLVSEYRMNMTRYVQSIINGKATRRDFKLEAPYYAAFANGISSYNSFNPIAYGRVQLGGGSHPQYPMYVRIYYSKE